MQFQHIIAGPLKFEKEMQLGVSPITKHTVSSVALFSENILEMHCLLTEIEDLQSRYWHCTIAIFL